MESEYLKDAELEEKDSEVQTERKQADEELLRIHHFAELGELYSGIAHELRQPLSVISNAIYYLKMTLPEADETTKEYLNMISDEARNAGDIISGFLKLTRTGLLERQEVEVSSLIDKALKKFTLAENIELKKDIPADIPPILVDPTQIGQVFYNIINNAIQAMSEVENGELAIKAKSKEKEGKTGVEVSFSDTGVGISKENTKKLFEPLFTTKASGIGLGLSICKNLVEANEGELEVQSEEGKGTTVTIIIPTK